MMYIVMPIDFEEEEEEREREYEFSVFLGDSHNIIPLIFFSLWKK